MADQEYCLTWNNHQSTLTGIFDKLLQASRYTDCTISAGGKNVAAHKVLLTACSPYFDSVFSGIREDRHAVIVLSDITYAELQALMNYMYRGEVNISQDRLAGLLKVAEALQIRGLYEPGDRQTRAPPPPDPAPPPVAPSHRPIGLATERSRHTMPSVAMKASRDNAVRSPNPKRRKRATDFPRSSGDLPTGVDPAAVAADDLLRDPPQLKDERAFGDVRPKRESLNMESIILDDDDDSGDNNGSNDVDETQQPGTSTRGEGSSQGYPASWNDQSNDEAPTAARPAGDGPQAGGSQQEGYPTILRRNAEPSPATVTRSVRGQEAMRVFLKLVTCDFHHNVVCDPACGQQVSAILLQAQRYLKNSDIATSRIAM